MTNIPNTFNLVLTKYNLKKLDITLTTYYKKQ